MTRLKRFKIGLFTITLGMVLGARPSPWLTIKQSPKELSHRKN